MYLKGPSATSVTNLTTPGVPFQGKKTSFMGKNTLLRGQVGQKEGNCGHKSLPEKKAKSRGRDAIYNSGRPPLRIHTIRATDFTRKQPFPLGAVLRGVSRASLLFLPSSINQLTEQTYF